LGKSVKKNAKNDKKSLRFFQSEGKYGGTKRTYTLKPFTNITGQGILTVIAEPGGVSATCKISVK